MNDTPERQRIRQRGLLVSAFTEGRIASLRSRLSQFPPRESLLGALTSGISRFGHAERLTPHVRELFQTVLDHLTQNAKEGPPLGRALLDPLIYAIQVRQREIVQMLIDAGADVDGFVLDEAKRYNTDKDTRVHPVYEAARTQNLEVLSALADSGAALDVADHRALRVAVASGNTTVVAFLLNHGLDPDVPGGKYGPIYQNANDGSDEGTFPLTARELADNLNHQHIVAMFDAHAASKSLRRAPSIPNTQSRSASITVSSPPPSVGPWRPRSLR